MMVSGCFRTAIDLRPDSALEASKNPTHAERFKMFFFWGFIPTQNQTNINDICPQGTARIKTHASLLDNAFTAITLGIVGFRTLEVWCVAPPLEP